MKRDRHSVRGAVVLAAILAVFPAACGGGIKTHPVNGKVVLKGAKDASRLAGGKVRLQSVSDPLLMPVGEIEDDGTFSVGTMRDDKGLPGAPAGDYKVRIEPPTDDENETLKGIVHPKYRDFDTSGLTLTVPPPGEVVLEVSRTGRR